MDSLGSLNAFVQAAEARSFTAAGRQLGVSSSAIGKAVARMEEQLGVRLFIAARAASHSPAEGALFLERCRRIFSEIEAAELELSKTHEAPRGTLRVSLPLAGMLMMPTLVAFMRAYPEIKLDLDFSDRVVDVIGGGLRRRGAVRRGWRLALDDPGFGHISPTSRGGPGLSGGQGVLDPGRPQGSCLPVPQVSDQRKVRAMAAATRICRHRERTAQNGRGQVRSSR